MVVRLQDGTFVDDSEYFKTLAPQTIFILSAPDQAVFTGMYVLNYEIIKISIQRLITVIHSCKGYELLYNMLSSVHKDYLNVGKLASDFLNQDLKVKIREISSVLELQSSQERAKLSKRDEDPMWFEGNIRILVYFVATNKCCILILISFM